MLLMGIPDQFRGRGEKCSLIVCSEGVLAAKPFFQLVAIDNEADLNITCICSMYIKLF